MTTKVCVVAAGGTGGHMFPAEALAEVLLKRLEHLLLRLFIAHRI